MKLLDLLLELQPIPFRTIKLGDIKYFDMDYVDADLPFPSGVFGTRRVIGEKEFNWWKQDMLDRYSPDTLLIKKPNPDKKFWYHGKYKLEIFDLKPL